MKRKVLFAALLTVFSCSFLFAQLKQIKGRVVDESGAGLDGASVKYKEKGTGVLCDSAGNFTLKIADDGKPHDILISSNGFNEKKITVSSSSSNVTVKLTNK